jgi:flagellar basal-body rod modification protein FlgD
VTTIDPTSTVGSTTPGGQSSGNPLQQLDNSKTFLELLVAQLKYQNPLNPMSGTQFITQAEQLTEVETVTNLANELSQAAAVGLIGRDVTASVGGKTVSGTVSAVTVDPTGSPTLEVGSTSVPLGSVTKVT